MRRAGKKTLIILSCALTAGFIIFALMFSQSGAGGITAERKASHEAVMTGRNTPAESASPLTEVNINTASVQELALLPGIGEKLAEAVVSFREANGMFESADDILNVPGIGEGKLSAIKDIITVGR